MILQNKIDFMGIIVAQHCNPNGDPLNNNRPREDWDGIGEISDVCLKRKIRNRLAEMGNEILLVSSENVTDGLYSIKARVEAEKELMKREKAKDVNGYIDYACKKWIDVRTFGQLFAFSGVKQSSGVSICARGPVSIGIARSIRYVNILDMQITKSINSDDVKDNPLKKDSTTMGQKHIIDHGIYPHLAQKTGFSDEDAEMVKQAMVHMFVNDASAARPVGSMIMDKLIWWQHNSSIGQYSPKKLMESVTLTAKEKFPYYDFSISDLPGLVPEIIEGW